MPYRFDRRKKIDINRTEMFKQIKTRRGRDFISLYSTAVFNRISDLDLQDIDYESYIWARGDRFYKLADQFYGDSSYWWIIAMFNNAPTEQHISIGEEIFIPLDYQISSLLIGDR